MLIVLGLGFNISHPSFSCQITHRKGLNLELVLVHCGRRGRQSCKCWSTGSLIPHMRQTGVYFLSNALQIVCQSVHTCSKVTYLLTTTQSALAISFITSDLLVIKWYFIAVLTSTFSITCEVEYFAIWTSFLYCIFSVFASLICVIHNLALGWKSSNIKFLLSHVHILWLEENMKGKWGHLFHRSAIIGVTDIYWALFYIRCYSHLHMFSHLR